MSDLLDISNVVRVTVTSPGAGLPEINTSALALFTTDVPIVPNYGDYRIYRNDTGPVNDFGSSSSTARIASVVFAQNPNIITGGGYLIIIPQLAAAPAAPATLLSSRRINFTELTGTDYEINLAIDAVAAADLTIGEIDTTSISTIQASLNSSEVAAANIEFVVTGEVAAANVELRTDSTGASSALVVGDTSAGTNIASFIGISGSATGADAGSERVKDAILRAFTGASPFGIILNTKPSDTEILEIGSIMQNRSANIFIASNTAADYAAGGIFDQVRSRGFRQTRCLFHGDGLNDALDFAAAYASRGMATNFNAANTASTMHLKDLIGIAADSSISETQLTAAQNAGVDVMVNFGTPKVFTSGGNGFFDSVYHLLVARVRIQIAYFNLLATTTTKIPQTESGLTAAKSVVRDAIRSLVFAGVFAPGEWNSPGTIGDPEDHRRNIREQGYYIYTQPITEQLQSQRERRIAPVMQIALKESGAIHSGDVIVTIEP